MEKDIIVGIGEVLWDIFPEGKQLGGAPANFAYHISQFGLTSCVASAVGNDALGKEILDTLHQKGLTVCISTTKHPTGTVQAEVDRAGVPCYDIKTDVAWDNIPFSEELITLAQNTRAVCFGTLAQRSNVSRETISRFIDTMPKSKDSLVIFDANLRQSFYSKEIIEQSLQRCNILKINEEELPIIINVLGFDDSDIIDECTDLLNRYDLKIVILTCGADGSYIFHGDEVSYQPTPKVKVADTVGAGDSFTAAFTASILQGKSIAEAHLKAVEVSAYVCTQQGAMPPLPKRLI